MQHRLSLLLLALAFAGAAGCDSTAPAQAEQKPAQSAAPGATQGSTAPAPAAEGSGTSLKGRKFGQPVTEAAETRLGDIAADPAKFADQTVRTTGTVKAVCQAAGCWMEIGDDVSRAHIKMAGHAFFVPKDGSGHTAVVQGTVKRGAATNDCKADACGGPENGELAKLEIVATGVEFVD